MSNSDYDLHYHVPCFRVNPSRRYVHRTFVPEIDDLRYRRDVVPPICTLDDVISTHHPFWSPSVG